MIVDGALKGDSEQIMPIDKEDKFYKALSQILSILYGQHKYYLEINVNGDTATVHIVLNNRPDDAG